MTLQDKHSILVKLIHRDAPPDFDLYENGFSNLIVKWNTTNPEGGPDQITIDLLHPTHQVHTNSHMPTIKGFTHHIRRLVELFPPTNQ